MIAIRPTIAMARSGMLSMAMRIIMAMMMVMMTAMTMARKQRPLLGLIFTGQHCPGPAEALNPASSTAPTSAMWCRSTSMDLPSTVCRSTQLTLLFQQQCKCGSRPARTFLQISILLLQP